MEEANQYKSLLEKYVNNECSPEEFNQLMDFLQKDESNRLILSQLQQEFGNRQTTSETITGMQSQQVLRKLLQKLQPVPQAPVVFLTNRIKKIAIAAAVIIILGVGAYSLSIMSERPTSTAVQPEPQNNRYKNDALPGTNKATLTLADGRVIELDDANNGTLAQEGNTTIIKIGARLAYNASTGNEKEILYNTITTPRGGQYQIELPDGSLVWLNSASSLRFPTLFAGKQRRVTMTGEGYFEIAKNASMPFVVSVNETEINVLGTHFNVMAYEDEPGMKTTLLEGAVKLSSGTSKCVLKPGQQSHLLQEGDFKVQEANVTEVMAWKNGRFHFERADIKNVMSQLSRWYDVEIVYQRKINTRFYLEMSRNTKLSEILKVLELTGNIKFDIVGKKIIVS